MSYTKPVCTHVKHQMETILIAQINECLLLKK